MKVRKAYREPSTKRLTANTSTDTHTDSNKNSGAHKYAQQCAINNSTLVVDPIMVARLPPPECVSNAVPVPVPASVRQCICTHTHVSPALSTSTGGHRVLVGACVPVCPNPINVCVLPF